MKRILTTLAVAIALTGLAATAHAADFKPRLVRFGYNLGEDSTQGRGAKFFGDEVAKNTGGKWKVKGFGSASLGSALQMQDALIAGTQEMMVTATATLFGIVSDFGRKARQTSF